MVEAEEKYTMVDTDDVIMDSDDINKLIPKSAEQLGELKKENGNQLFKIKQYRSALPLYSEAIELCPQNAAFYGNRSACYIMMGRYLEALDDARKSIQLDSNYVKGKKR